jgi:hypothetical protein
MRVVLPPADITENVSAAAFHQVFASEIVHVAHDISTAARGVSASIFYH